tara:strand:- start:69 stop:308 length:240 start_codon:yes stop_codon:yes gene_type:complete
MNNEWIGKHRQKRRILVPKRKLRETATLPKKGGKPSTKGLTNQTATGNNNIQINANNVNVTIVNNEDTLRDSVKMEERK